MNPNDERNSIYYMNRNIAKFKASLKGKYDSPIMSGFIKYAYALTVASRNFYSAMKRRAIEEVRFHGKYLVSYIEGLAKRWYYFVNDLKGTDQVDLVERSAARLCAVAMKLDQVCDNVLFRMHRGLYLQMRSALEGLSVPMQPYIRLFVDPNYKVTAPMQQKSIKAIHDVLKGHHHKLFKLDE